jgi:acetolactate synthase-1/3 small subunit
MQSCAPAGFSRAFPIRKRSPAEAGSRAFAKDEPPTEAGGKDKLRPVFFTPPLTAPLPLGCNFFKFDAPGFTQQTIRPSMRHTLSVLVENKFGVLTRVAGMFSGRGFNIDTLNVGPTLDPSRSRMTIVVMGDDAVLEQVTKQLNKLIDVIEIEDFRDNEYVDRELMLLRVNVDAQTRSEVMQICNIFRAKIIDVQPRNVAIELTGNESKIEKFLFLMEPFGISDLTRTGKVAVSRRQ